MTKLGVGCAVIFIVGTLVGFAAAFLAIPVVMVDYGPRSGALHLVKEFVEIKDGLRGDSERAYSGDMIRRLDDGGAISYVPVGAVALKGRDGSALMIMSPKWQENKIVWDCYGAPKSLVSDICLQAE